MLKPILLSESILAEEACQSEGPPEPHPGICHVSQLQLVLSLCEAVIDLLQRQPKHS